jgi:soluble lytic murein transglycosylase
VPDALTAEQVTAFRAKWSDSPLADRLLGGWLDNAFAHARYEAFVDHYQDDGTVTRRCQHLRALMRTGRRDEALAGVPTLWLVGNSQPPVCDPLFAAWIESRALTQTLVWQRIELALENNQIALARHLTRYLNGTPARRAQAFIAVAQRPELVLQRDRYREDDPQMRAIVSLGLRRTARNDPEAAQNAWRHYEDALAFSATDARAIDQTLTQTLARRGILVDTPDVSVSPGDRHLEAAEAFVVAAIAAEEPARALEVIASLPAENRSQER